jgi:hypothetical protein
MKRFLICLLFFAGCKKETPEEPKPNIYLTFEEYPSGVRMNDMKVNIGFYRFEFGDYHFAPDRQGQTINGIIKFLQDPSGQYIIIDPGNHFNFTYHVPGHLNAGPPANYVMLPGAVEAKLTKKEGLDSYFNIPLYRKKQATLILKQITPSSQFPANAAGGSSNFSVYWQAFDADTTDNKSIATYGQFLSFPLTNGNLLDAALTIDLFDELYNCLNWKISAADGTGGVYATGKTAKFKSINVRDIITIEF